MTFDEQLRRAFDTLSNQLRDDLVRRTDAVSGELAAAAQAERERVALDTRQASEREAAERLNVAIRAARADQHAAERAASQRRVDAIRALEQARSLSEVLDALMEGAGREAARACILLIRGQQLRGWRLVGFDLAGAPHDLELPRDRAGVITDAIGTAAVASTRGAEPDRAPSFGGLPSGCDCLAVPLTLGGQAVAVLYADQGPQDQEARAEHRDGLHAAPIEYWRDSLEVLARHAARCLEVLAAVKAARALVDLKGPSAPSANTNEAEAQAAARRYARLLVSEIKLYHEAQVVAGRRERDLATRLGGEIARARAMYEQRVATELRRRHDYFHDELVRTLADGDEELLAARTSSP